MRIGVISDVHGNRFALQAVLKELLTASPDLVINLGDQAYGAADPRGAIELQHSLGALEVRGNNDERLSPNYAPPFDDSRRFLFTAWVRATIGLAAARRLGSLPLTMSALNGELLAFHASPTNTWQAVIESWEGGRLVRTATEEELLAATSGFGYPSLIVTGHTHRERLLRFQTFTVVNVGAVGWQHDGDPRARWTLLTRIGKDWAVRFHRIEYDIPAAAEFVARCSPDPLPETRMLRTGVLDRG